MRRFAGSEIGRGVTVALISVGVTLAFIIPVLLMELLQNLG